MRALIAICAICLLASCRLSLDAVLAPLDCGDSYNHRGSTCEGVLPGAIVIVIGPSRQYSDPSDALCYQVSPVTATVNEADWVLVTTRLAGWEVMAGGTITVSVAPFVTLPTVLLATKE